MKDVTPTSNVVVFDLDARPAAQASPPRAEAPDWLEVDVIPDAFNASKALGAESLLLDTYDFSLEDEQS